jgi:hypothetical protein
MTRIRIRIAFALAFLLISALPLSAECEYWACVVGDDYASCSILYCNNPPCQGQVSWTRSLSCTGVCDGPKGCWCRQSSYCYDI